MNVCFLSLYKYPHNIPKCASWLTKPKIFTIWAFAEKVCQPQLQRGKT